MILKIYALIRNDLETCYNEWMGLSNMSVIIISGLIYIYNLSGANAAEIALVLLELFKRTIFTCKM